MKKVIFALFAVIFFLPLFYSPPAPAADPSPAKVALQAISSASGTTCIVWGMPKASLAKTENVQFIQAFRPRPDLVRSYSLGNKGMSNYSTNLVSYFQVQCHTTGTNTTTDIKAYLDSLSSYYMVVGATPWGFAISQ
jgi:hypothetical protein